MNKHDYSKYAEMYKAGMSLPKISAKSGINTGQLYRGIKKLGVRVRNMTESHVNFKAQGGEYKKGHALMSMRKFDHDEAKSLYVQGMSLNALSAHFGIGDESIRGALKRAGVTMRRRGGGDGGYHD